MIGAPPKNDQRANPNDPSQKFWLHVYASLLALASLQVIGTGAIITSEKPMALTEYQSPPATMQQDYVANHAMLLKTHTVVADAVVLLGVGFIVCLAFGDERKWIRSLGVTAIPVVLFESVRSEKALLGSASSGFFHGYLGHLFFVLIVAIAVFTSQTWGRLEPVENRFSLRTLALLVPCFVLVQIAMGAAYRHQLMGVLMHIFGAFIVAVFVLLVGVLAVKQYPQHRTIRPAAVTLMSVAGCQVILGFAAFIMRLLTNDPTLPLVIFTVSHVVTGSLTLAASVVLTIYILRNVQVATGKVS